MTEYLGAVESGRLVADPPIGSLKPVEGGFLGGPIALAGRSAVVFCMDDGTGTRHALRAFLSQPTSNLARLTRLETHGLPIPTATWHEAAFEVDGKWWPAQLLPWCEGTPLDLWMVRNRADGDALRDVATTIIEHVVSMAERGIVHGDLQHGNILVDAGGAVTFVDLDGLTSFDTETGLLLPGWDAPDETGHPNFQHPERAEKVLWSPSTDIYSALVIDVALRAAALDPTLIDDFYVEDNLLLTRADLEQPTKSEAFRRLRELGDSAVSLRCDQLEGFSRLTIAGPRPARHIIFGGGMPSGASYQRPWHADMKLHSVASDWDMAEKPKAHARPAQGSAPAAAAAPDPQPAATTTPPIIDSVPTATGPFSTTPVDAGDTGGGTNWLLIGSILIAVIALVIFIVVASGNT